MPGVTRAQKSMIMAMSDWCCSLLGACMAAADSQYIVHSCKPKTHTKEDEDDDNNDEDEDDDNDEDEADDNNDEDDDDDKH